eukprot:ctg_2172.g358
MRPVTARSTRPLLIAPRHERLLIRLPMPRPVTHFLPPLSASAAPRNRGAHRGQAAARRVGAGRDRPGRGQRPQASAGAALHTGRHRAGAHPHQCRLEHLGRTRPVLRGAAALRRQPRVRRGAGAYRAQGRRG